MIVALDTETDLITPTCLTPALACLTVWDGEDEDPTIFPVSSSYDIIGGLLNSDALIFGHNIAYDLAVLANEWPDLMPLIFKAYRDNRITDTMLREKLQHIALGILRGYRRENGAAVKLSYELDKLVMRRCGLELEKGDGRTPDQLIKAGVPVEEWPWRYRYKELIDVPINEWPDEAAKYAIEDVIGTYALFMDQSHEGHQYLDDEFRQARAAWWQHLNVLPRSHYRH